jgi:dolichyl-phosphate-mannose--protein O-mannosyl transferase
MEIAGADRGTSIGIGYIAESYVDFGPVGMFIPIALLGAFYGLIYRQFVIKSRYRLVGCGIATAVLVFGGNVVETSNVKLVGGNLTALIVLTMFYFIFGSRLQSWLGRPDE